ncbi:MAG TPA: hypothetical protein DCG44_05580 [Candidatus Aquiluna sp.]|jgi:hypothetical protein|nr:hypothetical protein [Aquiluna sp.]
MAFYGKKNDEKHYSKIAKKILEINPSLTVEVVDEDHELDGDFKRVTVIRVFEDYEHMGHKFWVSPWPGEWFDYWIYTAAIPQKNGEWDDNGNVQQLGEVDLDYVHIGWRVKGFIYTNPATVMAKVFFVHGPLSN